ncbi:MAG: putative acid phosphatase [Labilithrix sp.]|nr:putative acid phosphatase [Labilithrix sp.]
MSKARSSIAHLPVPVVTALAALLTALAPACGSTDGPSVDDGPSADGGSSGSSGGGSSSGTSGGTGDAAVTTDGGDAGDASTTKAPLTVFTIVMENHDYDEIVGSPNAPYFNQLIADYGLATNYQDSGTHPSLPNYLAMISGDPQYPGIVDLDPKTFPFPKDQPNLGTQLEAAKIPWRSYQESMGTPCRLTSAGDYAPKHDPFLYFTDMQTTAGLCAQRSVDYGSFAADLASGQYRYMWITPNLTNDGHNPPKDPVAALKVCDAWAATNIPLIMNSAAYKANGILFITWDEAEGRSGRSKDQIPMIVVSPRIKSKGFKLNVAYSHASYLATIEDLFGLPRLATVTSTPSMLEFIQ